MAKLYDMIIEQQRGHEMQPRFMIGEQLKEIAEREPLAAELLERDLEIEEMSLEAAEAHFQKYADAQSRRRGTFCITPTVAEKLLREFYGLPGGGAPPSEKKDGPQAPGYIDLSSFL